MTPKKEWQIKEPNIHIYKANLEALGVDTIKALNLMDHTEKPIPMDDDVKVTGLKNPTCLVILGFSTLNVLKAAKENKKEIKHVVIIEPDLGVFHQTIRRELITDTIKDPSIDLIVGVDGGELRTQLYKVFTHSDPTRGPRAAFSMQPEIVYDPFVFPAKDGRADPRVEELTRAVLDASKQVGLSMGCAADSFSRWERMIQNEKSMAESYRIQPLFEKFKDVPAIVVGAGPSMKDFIDAYHEHKLADRALIIACDASLKLLLDSGVTPHVVTRCERKFTKIFSGVTHEMARGVYYAGYPWCAPEYFELFPKSFMLFRDNGVCKWTQYEPGSVNGGVSSANAALELAFLLGCKEIVLTGVDLCFLDGRSHIEGTEVEFDIEKSKPKWTQIPGNEGETVTTIPVWYRCLNEYQQTLFKYQGRGANVFNTSLKGAQIAGTRVMPWSELQALFKAEKKIPKLIEASLEKHPPGYEETYKKKKAETLKFMKSVVHELEKVFLFIDDAMLTCKREEEKVIGQIKAHSDPNEFFANVKSVQDSLSKIYEEPARQIDQFKQKYYTNPLFSETLIDMCQLDYFQTENKCSGLRNNLSLDHERLKTYVTLQMLLFRIFHYYAKHFVTLLDKGPDLTVDVKVPSDLQAYWGGFLEGDIFGATASFGGA
jgi:hypothetical protein